MTDCIAVLNAGSSSIKFALYDAQDEALLCRGQIESIGLTPRLTVQDAAGTIIAERSWLESGLDHPGATQEIVRITRELLGGRRIGAVGHRVVHGGTRYAAPIRINSNILADLELLVPLAPLHQPHNLAPIRTLAEHAPTLPQVACFDTAFHRGQSQVVQSFGLPRAYLDEGVRRYGFHGLSYEFVTAELRRVAPDLASSRLVIAHLGNGASLCAVHNGRSVASTMGFTAVDGLMMGTRCGAVDPGVIVYLMDRHGLDARGIEDLIYRNPACWVCPASRRTCARCAPPRRPKPPRRSRCSSTASSVRLDRLPLPLAGWTGSCSPPASVRTTPLPVPRSRRGAVGWGLPLIRHWAAGALG